MDAIKMQGFFGAHDRVEFNGKEILLGNVFDTLYGGVRATGSTPGTDIRPRTMQVRKYSNDGLELDYVKIDVEARRENGETIWGHVYYFHLQSLRLIKRIEYSAGEKIHTIEQLLATTSKRQAIAQALAGFAKVNNLTAEGMNATCYQPCSPGDCQKHNCSHV